MFAWQYAGNVAALMGRNMKKRIDAREISIRRLADMCGVSASTVSRALNGATGTTLETWLLMCHAVGCGIDDLVNVQSDGGDTN